MTADATSLRAEYDLVVAGALAAAPHIPPPAAGLTASVDALWRMDDARLAALDSAAAAGDRLAGIIRGRILEGRGGEIVDVRDDGDAWLDDVFGAADVRQIGGNAAQACWALVSVGALALLALRDRSPVQLEVLDDRILVATENGVAPVGQVAAAGRPTKSVHAILEFTAGTVLDGRPLPRSTRVMLRFGHEPLEADAAFLRHCATRPVPVALVSGLATQPDLDTPDATWARDLATTLRGRGALVHHELSEFAHTADLRAAIGALTADSIGLSLSELTMAAGPGDPADSAVAVAEATGAHRIVVHADEWAMTVTRDPSPSVREGLLLANALASARARSGRPADRPFVGDAGILSDDIPPSAPVRDGWHAVAVAAPYEPRPQATVGLGDTFVAGLLLGDAIHRTDEQPTERHDT